MAQASANGISIEYETFGECQDPALLLIMGLGVQMIAWQDDACEELASLGFFVIRFDNRDCGLSTKLDTWGIPDLLGGLVGDASTAAYTLADMARDTVGLLDFLEIRQAHVVGISMGGMIAQECVIGWPQRFLSIASIMSSTGSREVGQPSPEAIMALMQPMGLDRESRISRSLEVSEVLSSPNHFDKERVRTFVSKSYDRCFSPEGVSRQLMAVLVSPDRTQRLTKVTIPAVVIHGRRDKMIDISGGYATSHSMPRSRLLIIDELGHDLPEEFWPDIRDAIVSNAKLA